MSKLHPTIFISHSGCADFIHTFTRYLTGYSTIISDWTDRSGSNLAAKVMEDIERSDLVVIVLDEAGLTSAWVNQEIGYARGLGKKLLPIVATKQPHALLEGLESLPFDPKAVDACALRAVLRVSNWLQEDLVQLFTTYDEYWNWWMTIDEITITSDKCYWATPHDFWTWFVPGWGLYESPNYRTLIRGESAFDNLTVHKYYSGQEVVLGVNELCAFEELAVIGSMTVQSIWNPRFTFEQEQLLEKTQDINEIESWIRRAAHIKDLVEVRVVFDAELASRHKHRLDLLFERHHRLT